MDNLTIIQLSPERLQEILKQVLESFFNDKKLKNSVQATEQWFDLHEICNYIPGKPAKATVYGWISKKEIPHHKRGKKLYFLKSEIDVWLKTGRKKTLTEIDTESDQYLLKIKRG